MTGCLGHYDAEYKGGWISIVGVCRMDRAKKVAHRIVASVAIGARVKHQAGKIVMIVSDGFSLTDAMRLADIFRLEDSEPYGKYQLLTVSANGAAVRSSTGVSVWTDTVEVHYIEAVRAIYLLGGAEANDDFDERLVGWLRCAYSHADVVQGVGNGKRLLDLAALHAKVPGGADGRRPIMQVQAGSVRAQSRMEATADAARSSAIRLLYFDRRRGNRT